jgi:GDP-L-fucose synthase
VISDPPPAFYSGRRVVVTGASGLLGSALIDRLLSAGAKVRAVVHRRKFDRSDPSLEVIRADLANQAECDAVMEGMEMACLCASTTVGAAEAVRNPAGAVTENLVVAARTLQASCAAKVERVLLVSSTTVYPACERAVREDEAFLDEPHPVYQGVGNMKRYVERLARFYHDKYGMRFAIVRPVPFFGPHDNFDFATCHVIPSLIRKAVEKQNPFEVWGGGRDVRDFLHVDDVARGCLLALERYAETDAVNLGSGRAVTIAELAGIIARAAGHDAPPLFDPTKPSTIPIRIVDTGKASERLGFAPARSLEDGLADAIAWFRRNRERLFVGYARESDGGKSSG